MKKVLILLLCVTFLIPLIQPVLASEPKIIDNADILTDTEEALLEAYSCKKNMDEFRRNQA